MKNIALAYSLLKDKKLTYKEIAKLTGYHSKHLIRIKKRIDAGLDVTIHQSKGRNSSKKISDEEKKQIINLQNKHQNINLTSFYKIYINSNKQIIRSYNTIYKLLRANNIKSINGHKEDKKTIKNKTIIIANFKYTNIYCFLAINKNREIIYVNLSNKDKIDNIIITLYNLLTSGNEINELMLIGKIKDKKEIKNILKRLNIKYNKNNININKEIKILKNKLNELKKEHSTINNINEVFKETYNNLNKKFKLNLEDKMYRELDAKTININTCQTNNKRYEILIDKQINKGYPIKIIRYIITNTIKVKINGKIYDTKLNKSIISIKGNGKYN